MALVVHLARPHAATLPPVAALLTLIATGVASYCVAVALMDRQRLQDLRLLVARRG